MFGQPGQPTGAMCPTCVQKLQFADLNPGASRSPCKRCQQRKLKFAKYRQQPPMFLSSSVGCKRDLFSRDAEYEDDNYRKRGGDNDDRLSPFTHSTSPMDADLPARPSVMPSLSPSLGNLFHNMILPPTAASGMGSRSASTDPVLSMPVQASVRPMPVRPAAQVSNLVQCQNLQCRGFIHIPLDMPMGQGRIIMCRYCTSKQLY